MEEEGDSNSYSNNYLAKEQEQDQKQKKKKEKPKSGSKFWPLKAFLITIILSVLFNVISSAIMTDAGITIIIIVIVILIIIGVIFDMIGMAVASCEEKPFYSMAAKKVKGAKVSLKLIKNSDIVGSICSDIIGDICNIISGAASATLVLIVALRSNDFMTNLISVAITAVLAAITVGMKAVSKKVAVSKSVEIVSGVGKILSIFSRTK
mgnify:CR=1 FL=1